MNDNELKNIWQTTNERLEKSLTLITNNTDDISRMKAGNFLHSIRSVKFLALLAGVAWVGIGVTFLSRIYMNGYSGCNKFFLFSATFQILLTAISLFLYLYQLIKIHQTDVFGPILQTQEKLAQIKISTLWVVRILFLQLPLWTIFWWNNTMLQEWNALQWAIVLTVTGSLTFIAIWLFFNVKYENRDKKWFKLIFSGKEWTALMKSIELLGQVNEFKEK